MIRAAPRSSAVAAAVFLAAAGVQLMRGGVLDQLNGLGTTLVELSLQHERMFVY